MGTKCRWKFYWAGKMQREANYLIIDIILCQTCVWNRSILDGLGYDGPVEWYTSFEVSSFPETY